MLTSSAAFNGMGPSQASQRSFEFSGLEIPTAAAYNFEPEPESELIKGFDTAGQPLRVSKRSTKLVAKLVFLPEISLFCRGPVTVTIFLLVSLPEHYTLQIVNYRSECAYQEQIWTSRGNFSHVCQFHEIADKRHHFRYKLGLS